MGQASSEGIIDQERREAGWLFAAEAKGFRCGRCGEIPPHCERETFFETGMCGYCSYLMSRDD
jgi:hypothetical protein